jgi:hypothetical protein
MSILAVRIKRGRDGPPVLTCTRADGTSTYSRLHSFFPMHDLTHFAVESTLGIARGFFGLVADGWEISPFAKAGSHAPIPAEAVWVECAVAALQEESTADPWASAAAFNERVAAAADGIGVDCRRAVTDEELERVRAAIGVLRARWSAVEPGQALELSFTPGVAASIDPP